MARRPQNVVMGGIFMLLFSLFLAMMSGVGKYAQYQASPFQVVFFQQLVGLVCITPVVLKRRGIKGLKTHRIGLHITRDLAGTIAYLALFAAINYIPLVNAVLLNNTGPLFLPIIVWIWFRKKIPLKMWWGTAIGFFGILLILQPVFGIFDKAMLLGLLSGVGMSITFISQRMLNKTEGLFQVLFYYFLVSTLALLPFAIWQWKPIDGNTWGALLGVGILNLFAQNCMVFAFSYNTASVLAPLIYFAVIFSGIIDWIFWRQIPNLLTLIGIALIILGGILSLAMGQLGHASKK